MEQKIQDIAREAGKITMQYFRKADLQQKGKTSKSDIVTEADLAADAYVKQEIQKYFPEHGIISEELDDYQTDAEYVWTIDPVDGTRNFASGFPLFAVMLATVRNGEVILSAVYQPFFDVMYFAKKGEGAFKNGKNITCSTTDEHSFAYGCLGTNLNQPEIASAWKKLINQDDRDGLWVNALGCAGFVQPMTADGTRDWVYQVAGGIWDVAPGYLLLKEAGCTVTHVDGTPWKFAQGVKDILAANPKLHPQIVHILAKS